jgi:hypothetical protein
MIFAMSCISLLGSVVWGHHLYTVGLETDTRAYFSGVTISIILPTTSFFFLLKDLWPTIPNSQQKMQWLARSNLEKNESVFTLWNKKVRDISYVLSVVFYVKWF